MNAMKRMTYYVVEVSFREDNPIHRAICYHRDNGYVELFGSYEGIITKEVKDLTFFRVVEEISSMKEQFENKFKLPKNAIKKK